MARAKAMEPNENLAVVADEVDVEAVLVEREIV